MGACTQSSNSQVLDKLSELYLELFSHDGFGEMAVSVRLLKRGQKEVILRCGKEFRYVIDFEPGKS